MILLPLFLAFLHRSSILFQPSELLNWPEFHYSFFPNRRVTPLPLLPFIRGRSSQACLAKAPLSGCVRLESWQGTVKEGGGAPCIPSQNFDFRTSFAGFREVADLPLPASGNHWHSLRWHHSSFWFFLSPSHLCLSLEHLSWEHLPLDVGPVWIILDGLSIELFYLILPAKTLARYGLGTCLWEGNANILLRCKAHLNPLF